MPPPAAAYIIIAMYIAFGSIGGAAGGAGTPPGLPPDIIAIINGLNIVPGGSWGGAAGVASVVDGTGWAAAGEAAANVSFVTKILAWSVRALAMNTGQVSPPRTLGTPCSSVYATCSVDGL
jgi:hypothetical protein